MNSKIEQISESSGLVFKIAQKADFEEIYRIMSRSFPAEEHRGYNRQKILMEKENYRIFTFCKYGAIQAFIAQWRLSVARFVEHFAVLEEERGKGIGTAAMKRYLREEDLPVVLEVETQGNQAERRIAFYERLGFCQSKIQYMQPSLKKEPSGIWLRLMYYPSGISDEALCNIKDEIMEKVYSAAKVN